jgi:hypothetical protein
MGAYYKEMALNVKRKFNKFVKFLLNIWNAQIDIAYTTITTLFCGCSRIRQKKIEQRPKVAKDGDGGRDGN